MKPLVSVALATYNVREYICESIKSILNQTLVDIEIICIDDHSTDGTVDILKRFAKEDSRLKLVLKKENQGLSVARNNAFEIATGKYICFLDGDDLMDKELLKKATEIAERENSDLVLWDYVVFWSESEINQKKAKSSSLLSINKKDKISLLQTAAFSWIKLIKTETFKKLNIKFPKGLTKQDIPVHWGLILKVDNISILPYRLSFYRQRISATSYKSDKSLFDVDTIFELLRTKLLEEKNYDTFKDVFLKQQLNGLFAMYDRLDIPLKPRGVKMIKNRLTSEHFDYINSKKPLLKQARIFYKMLGGSLFFLFYFRMWLIARTIYRRFN